MRNECSYSKHGIDESFAFQVVSVGDTGDDGDIMPTSGKVTFASGQASKRLELTVMADKVRSHSQIFVGSHAIFLLFFMDCFRQYLYFLISSFS